MPLTLVSIEGDAMLTALCLGCLVIYLRHRHLQGQPERVLCELGGCGVTIGPEITEWLRYSCWKGKRGVCCRGTFCGLHLHLPAVEVF